MRGFLAAVAAIALVGGAAPAPGAEPTPANAYRITVDLGPWIRALGTDDLFASEPAADALVALGPAAIPALAVALERESPAIRVGVVDVLERMGDAGAVPPLIRAARDPDEDVRVEALLALGSLGDERARPVVEAALNDADSRIYRAAAVACGSVCRSPRALNRLVDLALGERTAFAMAGPRNSLRALSSGADKGRAEAVRRAIEKKATPLLAHGGRRGRASPGRACCSPTSATRPAWRRCAPPWSRRRIRCSRAKRSRRSAVSGTRRSYRRCGARAADPTGSSGRRRARP